MQENIITIEAADAIPLLSIVPFNGQARIELVLRMASRLLESKEHSTPQEVLDGFVNVRGRNPKLPRHIRLVNRQDIPPVTPGKNHRKDAPGFLGQNIMPGDRLKHVLDEVQVWGLRQKDPWRLFS